MIGYYGERCSSKKSAKNGTILLCYQMYMVHNIVGKRKQPKLSSLLENKCKAPIVAVTRWSGTVWNEVRCLRDTGEQAQAKNNKKNE